MPNIIFKKVSTHSFSTRLSLWITGLTALIFIIAIGASLQMAKRVIQEESSVEWTLTTESHKEEVLQKLNRIENMSIVIAALGLLVLLVFSRMVILRLALPVRQFAAAAQSIADGNFNTELPQVHERDELYQLRYSLDEMQHCLSRYVSDLRSTTEYSTRIDNELQVAGRIQMSLLPKKFVPNPYLKNVLDIAGSLTPAKEVGGDFYDFVLRDDKLYFAIGDVSGKGVPAAMFMTITRSLFQHVVFHNERAVRMAKSINNSLSKNNLENMFVTAFIGILDLKTGILNYCNAGHNPPVLLGKDEPQFLESRPNICLGVMRGYEFKEEQIQLQPGQSLFLYTDGVTEAIGKQKEMLGEERMIQDLRLMNECSSTELVTLMTETLKEFTHGEPQTDDITLFHIKWKNNLS